MLGARGKRLKSLAIFGSSIYNPMRARDVDLLIVIDEIADALEKSSLELDIIKALKRLHPRALFDVLVFDEVSFKENLRPGAVLSGLVIGYEIIYDELGLNNLVEDLVRDVARGEYIVQKGERRINLSALARARLRTLRPEHRRNSG